VCVWACDEDNRPEGANRVAYAPASLASVVFVTNKTQLASHSVQTPSFPFDTPYLVAPTMQFCPACDNKLHMQIGQVDASASAPDAYSMPLTLYCKHCPFTKSIDHTKSDDTSGNSDEGGPDDLLKTFDPCMYRSNYSSNHPLYYSTVVNQYTFDDPTLPCLSDTPCVNAACASQADGVDPEILYVRYNDQDLKFLYLCRHCRQCWHFAEGSTNDGTGVAEVLFDFATTA